MAHGTFDVADGPGVHDASLALFLLFAPLRDLAFDRFGDVCSHELPDVGIDRFDQLRAGARDDRLQVRGELRLEAGVDEQIQALILYIETLK